MRILSLTIILIFLISPATICALPKYSENTNQSCKECHIEGDGGPLTESGLEFAASGYTWPPTSGYRVLSPFKKTVRLLIGFIHITAAFIWFGAILYVHILLRPAYASKGLPKSEVIMGMVSMLLVGITGSLLTVSRIKSIDVLYSSPWGQVLSLKIFLYLVMISSAIVAVTFVGPRLKKRKVKAIRPGSGVFDPVTLSAFDGKDGRESHLAHGGNVYDVSNSKLWVNGTHMKHRAGEDLTAAIERAPHGIEKLENLPVIGSFDCSLSPPKRGIEKVFYFVAYMNLMLVFCILFVVAYWRWGL